MKTSICMVTYNHEQFIAEAIESVLRQQVDFDYELVIGEDCSTDRTRQIVLDYTQKYPEKIFPLLRETNLGMQMNYYRTLQTCQGEYIALLEGDDTWTDPHKMQRQVDFLDANPDFSACFTRTMVFKDDDPSPALTIPGDNPHKTVFTTEDLLAKNYIATCSMVFRNLIREIDFAPFLSLAMIDWPLHLMISQHGPIGYINDVMAAYRIHSQGVWTERDEIPKLEAKIQACHVVMECLPTKYDRLITQKIVKTYQLIAMEMLRRGELRASRTYTLRSIAAFPFLKILGFKWYLKRAAILLLKSFNLDPDLD